MIEVSTERVGNMLKNSSNSEPSSNTYQSDSSQKEPASYRATDDCTAQSREEAHILDCHQPQYNFSAIEISLTKQIPQNVGEETKRKPRTFKNLRLDL
jgi:hypothetical protein